MLQNIIFIYQNVKAILSSQMYKIGSKEDLDLRLQFDSFSP